GASGPLAARQGVARLVQRQRQRRDAAREQASSDNRRALALVGIGGLFALALALATVSAILSAVRRPLDELVGAAGRLAAGDTSVRVDEEGPGELVELATPSTRWPPTCSASAASWRPSASACG